jgi:hypothetical protein
VQGRYSDNMEKHIMDWAEAVKVCDTAMDVEGLYKQLSRVGTEYGPEFQPLVNVHVGGGQAIGTLKCKSGQWKDYNVLPALIDGAMQLATAAAIGLGRELTLSVPFSIKKVIVSGHGAEV